MECTIQIWVSHVINFSKDDDNICFVSKDRFMYSCFKELIYMFQTADLNRLLKHFFKFFSYKSYGSLFQIGKPKEHNKRRIHYKQTEICKFVGHFVKITCYKQYIHFLAASYV